MDKTLVSESRSDQDLVGDFQGVCAQIEKKPGPYHGPGFFRNSE